MTRRHAFAGLIALITFFANHALAERLPRQPIFLPFAACKKAAILAFDFEATEDNLYTFLLTLQWNANDAAENARIAKFMGDGAYDPKTNKQIHTGLPIPLKLRIGRIDPAGETAIYDKATFEEELQSRGGSQSDNNQLTKVVDRIKLLRGNYRVHAEALTDIPELVGTPIGLGIYVHRPSVDLRPWRWRFPSQRWVFPEGRPKCGS